MYVHTEGGGVCVVIDLDLGEEPEGSGRETERDDTRGRVRLIEAVGRALEGDALEVTETREDELDEYAEEVPHLGALEVDLDTDGDAGADPALQVLAAPDYLHALCSVLATCLIVRSGDGTEGHDGAEEVGATDGSLLYLGVDLDALELDDVVW